MTVAHRSTATVTNTTAGTSVTVTKPSGTADGDVLVAFVAELGTGSITKPSGWTLIGTVAAGSALTLGAYWKVAASEGASWTWTLGSSVRNWGAVHAMTGVDTSTPVASSASDGDSGGGPYSGFGNDPVDDLPASGYLLTAIAGALAFTGTATTWDIFEQSAWDTDVVELLDVGTNGGSGTDITGTVLGFAAPERAIPDSGWMFGATCSQSQTSGASWSVALKPAAAAAYTGTMPTGVIVKAAFGADPAGDPDDWAWTDITADVRMKDLIRIVKGRADWASTAQPTKVTFAVNNRTGNWTPEHPTGSHFPNVKIDLPIQIIMPYGVTGASKRATVFVDSYRPAWDATGNWAIVAISASGRSRRINKNSQNVNSPLFQSLSGVSPGDFVPQAYWPCEDGTGATRFASAIAGAKPGRPAGQVTFASDSDLLSSDPLPSLANTATATFVVPPYTNTNQWVVYFVLKVPSEPAAEISLVNIRSSGSARRFVYNIAPGSPAELRLYMLDNTGATISSSATPLGVNGVPSEAEFFGSWCLHLISLADDGFGGGPTGWSGLTQDTDFNTLGGSSAGASFGVIQQIKFFAADGNSFGHVVVFTDPVLNVLGANRESAAEAFTAYEGEATVTRFARLSTERGIDHDYTWQAFARDGIVVANVDREPHTPMGAQPRGSLSALYRDIESTETTLIHDGGPNGELILDVLSDRYNRAVDLTVDMAQGQLALGFEPTYDDQRLIDDVTVTNRDGSSYRFATSTSGEHTGSASVNVSPEQWLAYIAGWQVNLGTTAGFRYPSLSFNLRATPELATDWLACQIGSRVEAVNLMSQHPSTTTANVVIEGYTETISTDRWEVELNVSPYQPYEVFEVASTSGNRGRADTAGCILNEAVNSSATSLKLHTRTGPRWITSAARPGDFPISLGIAGEQVSATAMSSVTSASFVAFGGAVAGNNASLAPGAPAGIQAGDTVFIWAGIRNDGTGTVDTPTGWTSLVSSGSCKLMARVYDGAWSMPTVTFTGGVANATTIAASAAFRGMCADLTSIVVSSAAQANASAANIAVPGLPVRQDNSVIFHLGWKQDDWTSVAPIGAETEIEDATSALGDDMSMCWDYAIQTTAADLVPATFTVTGGASAISRAITVALAGGYQTATVTRAANGVSKAQAAGEAVSLWKPPVIGL